MPVGKPENPYRESDEHVPNPTHVVDNLDTTGLGGNSRMQDVTPIFAETANRDLVEAAEALESRDPLRQANVILPGDTVADREAAKQELIERAAPLREEGYISPLEAQKQNFEAGAAPAGGDPVVGTTPAGTASGTTERPSSGNTQAAGAEPGSGVRAAVEDTLGGDPAAQTSSPSGEQSGQQQTGEQSGSEPAGEKYTDLLSKSATEVQAFLDANPDQAEAVKAEEREGKKRAGILNYTPRPKV